MSIWDLFQALLFSKGSHNNCDLRESLMFYGVFRSLGAHNEMWLSFTAMRKITTRQDNFQVRWVKKHKPFEPLSVQCM